MLDAMVDIYYGIITPTQALMMLTGEAPPIPKTMVEEVRRVLVEREKVMSADELKLIEKAVKLWKEYEYGTLKEFPGKEVDKLMEEFLKYNKKLGEMRKKLEKNLSEKTAEDIYGEVFKVLKTILGDKSQEELIKEFETKLVKKGKITPKLLSVLKELVDVKRKLKAGKLDQKEVERVKRDAVELVRALIEFAQRADLICSEKGTMQIIYGGRKAELVLMGENNFFIEAGSIRRVSKGKLVKATKEEFEKAFAEHRGKMSTKVSADVFAVLKKELGDFEIIF
jgi:hypothetical protein